MSFNQNKELTVQEVLSDLSKYNNEKIIVTGYYVSEFENSSLWSNKKDSENNNFRGSSIWIGEINDGATLIDFSGEKVSISYLRNKYVEVTGYFESDVDTIGNLILGHGHMNLWLGELSNITSMREVKNN